MRFALCKSGYQLLAISRQLVAAVFLFTAAAIAQIDPATQIAWPLITNAGTPTATGATCAAANYGQPYQNTAVIPNTRYHCAADGWELDTGATGPAGPNTVSTSTTTNITGLLKGNGSHVAGAVAGIDYTAPGAPFWVIEEGGQSLSTGGMGTPPLSTTQPYNNVMLTPNLTGYSLPMIPLIEGGTLWDGTSNVETTSSGLANYLAAANTTLGLRVGVGLHGYAGYYYTEIAPSTQPYKLGVDQSLQFRQGALANGWNFVPLAEVLTHGESDYNDGNANVTGTANPYTLYEGYLEQYQSALLSSEQAIAPNVYQYPLFISQMNQGWTGEMAQAQLQACLDNPATIFCSSPKYQLTAAAGSHIHLNNTSYKVLGEYYAKAIQAWVTNGTWKPLYMTGTVLSGSTVSVSFNIPVSPLVIDTANIYAHTHYGFEYTDATSSQTISSVALTGSPASGVDVVLSGAPGANAWLRYAWTCPNGTTPGNWCLSENHAIALDANYIGGNIRDSDSTVSPSSAGTGTPLYNWLWAGQVPIPSVPAAPTVSATSAGLCDTCAKVTFSTFGTSGYPITNVTATSSPGSIQVSGTTSPLSFTTLTTNTAYTFTVVSTNAYGNSAAATAACTILPPAATPTFSVLAGTYATAQMVTISDATPGAIIYYTTDGTTPTISSTVYSGPVSVSSSETLEAIATASGYTQSAVATTSYFITPLAVGGTFDWTWMGGSSTGDQPGVYGTLGVPAAENAPGSRYEAVSWTDNSGNLWLFGGQGADATGKLGYLNDLWEFNPFTNEWSWMGGSNTVSSNCDEYGNCGQPGVYGTLGTPAAGNIPGSLVNASSWTDSSGNLWLFGGYGFDSNVTVGTLNDLWKFNPTTNQWAWMGGSSSLNCDPDGGDCYAQPGVYGTLGTPAAGNIPGSRVNASSWTDSSGNLWLFGGMGRDASGTNGTFNDLWEFNPSTNQWAWMSGSSGLMNEMPDGSFGQSGVYGTLGSAAAGNVPGSRVSASSWTDSSGNLWLFGGWGHDAIGNYGYLNDLWEFNPSVGATGEWTWIGGSSTVGSDCIQRTNPLICGQSGVYGTLGTPAAANIPGSRYGATSWTDLSGNLWLFGGLGYSGTVGGDWGSLNDLWEYNPSTNEWAWMSGSSTVPIEIGQPGVYGTLGTPAATNVPGGRKSPMSWTDSSGNFWLFGGSGYDANGNPGLLNDLWRYQPQPTTASPTFNVSAGTYTSVQTVSISDTTPGATIYYTTNGTTPTKSSTVYSVPITVSSSETLQAIATARGYDQSAVATAAYTINLPQAATPTFSVAAGTYTTVQTVTISDTTPNATIYFTIDGTTPTTSSSVYSALITVSSTETIKAIAAASDYSQSAVATAAYTINLPQVSTPTISLAAGSYTAAQTVIITDATPAATIYYTTDGTQPATASSVYSGPIVVSSSETLEAMATASGYTQSAVAAAAYVVNISTNPVPVISSISPATASAGGTAFTLTVNGLEFTANSTIYWGTNVLTTTYVNATQLTAQVTADEIATAGITSITVQTPTPGGGTSSIFQFEVDTAPGTTTGTIFSSTTATVASGSPAAYPATLPSSMSSPTVTCLNLPPGATCSYSATTNTVTITTSPTTPAGTYLVTVVFSETVSGAASWILLPILLLPMVYMRKKLAERGVWITACLGMILLAATAFNVIGCGGGSSSTPPPTHQVTRSGVVTLTIH